MLFESLYLFGNLVTYALVIGLFLFSIVSFYNYYVDSKTRKALHVLEAKISMLRMLLKSKIRQRVNKFQQKRNNLKKDESPSTDVIFNRLKDKYDSLGNLEFSSSEDFDSYFSINTEIILDLEETLKSKKINLEQNNQKVTDENGKAINMTYALNLQDRWSKLLFYDKKSVVIIAELVRSTDEFRQRVQVYNASQKNTKKHFNEIKPIVIADFESLDSLLNVETEKDLSADSESTDEFEILNQKKAS